MELKKIKEIKKYEILASDGEIGSIDDFYIDDQKWMIRYLVVNTGGLLIKKKVLISPAAFKLETGWEEMKFPLHLDKKRVEDSPNIRSKLPVSKEMEHQLVNYYNWPVYWTAPDFVSSAAQQVSLQADGSFLKKENQVSNPHLRSFNEVIGYKLNTFDGQVGSVSDMVIDNKNYKIQYLVVKTGNWLNKKHVLIMPESIDEVHWTRESIDIQLTESQLKDAPPLDDYKISLKYHEMLLEYYDSIKLHEIGK